MLEDIPRHRRARAEQFIRERPRATEAELTAAVRANFAVSPNEARSLVNLERLREWFPFGRRLSRTVAEIYGPNLERMK